jgi:adenylyl- and sulfurtransferase ThiI
MITNIHKTLDYMGVNVSDIRHEHARIIIEVEQYSSIIERLLSRIFGVKSFSPAYKIETSDLREISKIAQELFCSRIQGKEFMVRVRRAGSHPFTSKDAEREIGGFLYDNCNPKKVNLTNPEFTVYIEIRDDTTYLYDIIVKGCLLYTSPSPRDGLLSRMPSSA